MSGSPTNNDMQLPALLAADDAQRWSLNSLRTTSRFQYMHKYQNGLNIIAIILFCTLGIPWNCFGGYGANTPNKSSITVGSKNTILIEKEKAVIKAEEIYRNEIRKKIEVVKIIKNS